MISLENAIKIIISGLDNAGKTSILTALDKKFDFEKEIMQLKPTVKVEYSASNFLGIFLSNREFLSGATALGSSFLKNKKPPQ